MKVLVADDDDSLREITKRVVLGLGYDVIEATDGPSAWEAFRRQSPPIIISDWMMPGLDGLGLCQKVRKAFRGDYTYFILITGHMTSQENFLRAMEAGADDFLTRPAEEDTVRVRLRVAERILSLTSRISRLESFLPICVYCKNIRQDNGHYVSLESYLSKRSNLEFSHGICPDCLAKHHPQAA